MAGKVLEFSDDDFETQVINSDLPVLVDFWAPWCGPCRMLAPTIEALAEEYDGKLRVGKVNVDENPRTATAYGISSIPTVLIFKGGEVVAKQVGAVPKAALEQSIQQVLSATSPPRS
ncbi:MAG: thioredoxin [Planctomycetota bacterium]|nr:MAG: thioredoxin [Planctomycetota bacterium]